MPTKQKFVRRPPSRKIKHTTPIKSKKKPTSCQIGHVPSRLTISIVQRRKGKEERGGEVEEALTKTSIEGWRLETRGGSLSFCRKGREGREGRGECSAKAEPVGAERQEDDRREAITKHPLQDAPDDHEHAAAEEINRAGRLLAESLVPLSPKRSNLAYEDHRKDRSIGGWHCFWTWKGRCECLTFRQHQCYLHLSSP